MHRHCVFYGCADICFSRGQFIVITVMQTVIPAGKYAYIIKLYFVRCNRLCLALFHIVYCL